MNKAMAVGVASFVLGMAAAALVAVNPAGWQWPSRLLSFAAASDAAAPAGVAPVGAASSEDDREILYWRAPMDPTFTSDRPGVSPMGMDLVPVYAAGGGDLPPGTVRIDPGFVQSVGVRKELVARRSIAQTIRTVGTLAHNDRQIAWVNTKYDGWIENVAVNYLGETSRSRRAGAGARRAAGCRSCPRWTATSSRRWTRRGAGCTSRRG